MRLYFFIYFLGAALLLQGQDKEAKRILDRLNKAYSSEQSIEINFDLTITFPEEDPLVYDSHVIQSDKKFLFKNSEHEYYGNGEDIWVYIRDQNEVQINDFEEEESEDYFITPLDLLNQYQSGNYEYVIIEQAQSKSVIEFKPTDEFSDYSKFRISANTKSNEINVIEAFGRDGSKILIEINELIKGQKYDDSIFIFDKSKYPGIIVEDLRLD